MSRAAMPDDETARFTRPEDEVTVMDWWLAAGLLGCGLILRLFYIWHFRIDSDEPQHLHVVWGWTQGLLPYHDFFDNHSPVFQALYAPLFHLLGERADILLPMRAAELPIFILTIFCVWRIARAFCAPRVALWTAVLAALFPAFYLNSIEFRPDQLWTLVWMLVLLVLATRPIRIRRMWLAGLLCGLAFSISMKTSLLVAALLQALLGALIVRWAAGGFPLRGIYVLQCAIAWLAGVVIIPGLVILYFYRHGVIREMSYCVIQHNVLPSSSGHVFGSGAIKTWLLGAVGAVGVGYGIVRLRMTIPMRACIAFVFYAPYLYCITLVATWPVITAEDYLPFFPAMMLTVGPAILWAGQLLLRTRSLPVGALLAVVEMASVLIEVSPFQDETVDKIGIVADTLKLTRPGDYVLDSKGETIYRRRAFYYVIESMTFHRMKEGIIPDTIAQELIDKRVPLATATRMTHDAREFIKKNYVPIAFRLFVLGKVLREKNGPAGWPAKFEITNPERYTLVTPTGKVAGLLDGTPFDGPRELAAGTHKFIPQSAEGKIVLIWAPAIERGGSPFAPIKEDYKTPQD